MKYLFNARLVLILSSFLLITGWSFGGDEAQAKKVVLANLKDSDSAKFGAFTRLNENNVCIVVNAKNSLGGYAGNEIAFVRKVDDNWELIGISSVLDPCAK
jgi:translation initiation factor 2 gamma subunit (eIF-2gamma)